MALTQQLKSVLPTVTVIFFNPLLFASGTDTFSNWYNITKDMKRSAQ
jgi:hypothetical protein